MRTHLPRLLVLLASLPVAAQAALPIEIQRVAPPAQLTHSGSSKKLITLLPHKPLDAGDTVQTGHNGRVSMMLDHAGQLALGDDSALFVHSVDPAEDGKGALARMALMRGSLRLDSSARAGMPPQDMRVNVGTLRVRAFGAEVWANVEPGQSQTLCLLQGSVEIVSDQGNESLDTPGDCFRYSSNNVRMRLRPDSDATLARKLSRTAFADDKPSGKPPVTVAAPQTQNHSPMPIGQDAPVAPAEPTHSETVALIPQPAVQLPSSPTPAAPAPAMAPPAPPAAPSGSVDLGAIPPAAPSQSVFREVAPPPAPAPANPPPAPPATAIEEPAMPALPPAAPMPAGKPWTVVIASMKNGLAADKEVQRLRKSGMEAEVWLSDAGNYRVCLGHFDTRDAAHRYAQHLQQTQKTKGWVAKQN